MSPKTLYGRKCVKIGAGTFAKVYKTDKNYAVKVFFDADDDDGLNYHFLREVSILKHIKHPNIIAFKAASKDKLYMELANCTLHDYLKKPMTAEPQWYLYQLLRAIECCHAHNIIHRDIKPQNILLFDNGLLKLTDFGLAKPFIAKGQTHTAEVCSLWWKAPEVLLYTEYSYPVDMWSYGVVMLEMVMGENCLDGDTQKEQLYRISKLIGKPTEEDWPGVEKLLQNVHLCENEPKFITADPIAVNLLKKILTWPGKRITAHDAMNHPYFDGVREAVEKRCPTKNTPSNLMQTPTKTIFNPKNRITVLEWMWEVITEFVYSYNTLFLAFNIFDRYLMFNPNLPMYMIQAHGVAAIMIAAKLTELSPAYIDKYVYICENRYNDAALQVIEKDIAKALDYNISINPFFEQCQADAKTCRYLIAMYLNYDWATRWSPHKFSRALSSYFTGEDNKNLADYFSGLAQSIRKKL